MKEGWIFLPQELEEQLGYENLPLMVVKSESFVEGIEYHVIHNSKLAELKDILKSQGNMAKYG